MYAIGRVHLRGARLSATKLSSVGLIPIIVFGFFTIKEFAKCAERMTNCKHVTHEYNF